MNSSLAGKPIERLRIGAAPADGNTYDVHIDQVTIQVASTEAAPTISLATSDGGSTYLTGQNVTLVASPAVSNSDNSVDSVEFYSNGQSLGLASSSPYQWTTSFANAGTCTVTAIVWDGHGVSTASAPLTLTIAPSGVPPAAPTGLAATAVSSSEIDLAWNASAGATSYNVLQSATDGGPYTQIATNVTTTSFKNTGLTASTAYYYVVQAVNGAGISADSAQASATTQAAVTIPAAPTNPTASAASASEIDLTWTASSGATSYNVARSGTADGPYTVIASGVTATSYNDTGLSPGTTYFYVVQAANSAGTSGNSNEASATTQSGGSSSLTETDIGAVSPAGSASDAGGTYTLNTGSGLQLSVPSTADVFSFDSQAVSGDCSLTTRVASLVCHDTAKGEGAVMIRETLATNSAFACIGVTTGRGVQFTYRASTGATSVSVAGSNVKAPYSIRLTRSGNVFTAYASVDGNTWTQVGTPQTIAMATTVNLGFAICNHGGTGTATFDNVTQTPATPAAPAISSPTTANGTYATPFTYAIIASNSPESYSATGLPDGVSLDQTSGVISGTPAHAGTFEIALAATNKGGTGAATLELTVAPAPVTIALGNVMASYDGQPKAVTTTTVPGGVPVTVTYGGATTAPSAVGTYAVVATSASSDYTGTATGTLTISDTTAPAITVPAPIVAEATGANGAAVTFSTSATDNVDGPVAVSASPASGSVFPLGVTPVTLTATDQAGNVATVTFTVTVQDTTAPALTLPANQVIEATSSAGAVGTFAATAADAVTANPAITYSTAAGSTFPIGTTTRY
ncbi:MAG TPA: MBG domain-containing protein [Opitutaceae bacterium]|nr:MBG domain-containing protein [Opitutaceae bacterium]